MSYRRRNYRRRRKVTRQKQERPGYFYKYYAKPIGQKAYQLAKYAISKINSESKYIDSTISETPSTAGGLVLLNGCAQGDGSTSRDGDSIRLQSVAANLYMSMNASSTTHENIVRVMIFVDLQTNGSTPAVTDVLLTANVNSFRNLSYGSRFKVLYDQRFTMVDADNYATKLVPKLFFKIDYHQKFSSTGSTISDISAHPVFMLLVSNAASNLPTVAGRTRVRFLDN